MQDALAPRIPKMPPRVGDVYSITKDKATQITQKKRKNLFNKQREELYKALWQAIFAANYKLTFYFDERVESADILTVKDELISRGFEVTYQAGHEARLKILWRS